MDAETLRAVASLARFRARMMDRTDLMAGRDGRDGLERLGAAKALDQLAKDLEAAAGIFGDEEG